MTETNTPNPVAELFDGAIDRYQSGEAARTLIPTFVEICDRSPKLNSAWTCLSWLYLLDDRPKDALKAAQKSLKIDPYDPQTKINLILAMLDTKQPGIREHVEMTEQLLSADEEIRQQAIDNMHEGFKRKPNWQSLERVRSWLFPAEPGQK
jgi:predicted Zn-dependent protease